MLKRFHQRGSILIFSLWTISLLSLFAVYIGLKVRQRASLLARIESHSHLRFIASAGVKKSIAALRSDIVRHGFTTTAEGKTYRHNNPAIFQEGQLGHGQFRVSYDYFEKFSNSPKQRFGIVDEESKLNINVAERYELVRLMEQVLPVNDEYVQLVADAIIEWRELGQKELTGFYSDDYYANLQYPYGIKHVEFEILEELLMVRGINQDVFSHLKPFITIYGDGRVNINTVSNEVLYAMGLDQSVADKVITVRSGADGREWTADDFIFRKTYDVASDVLKVEKLSIDEVKQIDFLNTAKKIRTDSYYYAIRSEGELLTRLQRLTVECVYNARENRIEFWREK